jgi:hypothetical protein
MDTHTYATQENPATSAARPGPVRAGLVVVAPVTQPEQP